MGIQRRVGIDVNLRLLLNNDSFLNRLLDDNGLLRFFYAQYPFVRFVKRFEFEAYAVVIGAGVFVVQVIGDFVAGRGNINRVGRNFVRFKAFVFLTGFFGTRVLFRRRPVVGEVFGFELRTVKIILNKVIESRVLFRSQVVIGHILNHIVGTRVVVGQAFKLQNLLQGMRRHLAGNGGKVGVFADVFGYAFGNGVGVGYPAVAQAFQMLQRVGKGAFALNAAGVFGFGGGEVGFMRFYTADFIRGAVHGGVMFGHVCGHLG